MTCTHCGGQHYHDGEEWRCLQCARPRDPVIDPMPWLTRRQPMVYPKSRASRANVGAIAEHFLGKR